MKKPTEKFRRTNQRPRRTPRIGALVHEFALASSVTLPSELAMAAAQASGQSTVTGELPVTLFSPKGGHIKTSGGLELDATYFRGSVAGSPCHRSDLA